MRIFPSSMSRRTESSFPAPGEEPPEPRIGEERSHLVLDRPDRFLAVEGIEAGILVRPEGAHLLVRHLRKNPRLELLVGEEPQDVRERRVAVLDERKERIPEDVLHAHSPGLAPDLLEGFEDAGDGKRDLVGADSPERVVAIGMRSRSRD